MEVKVCASPCEEKPKEYGKWDKWEIENCVDTLVKSEEIKADKEKMAYIKPILEKRLAGTQRIITSIKDIKAKIAEMPAEDEMDMED
jgi:hypothetical protein